MRGDWLEALRASEEAKWAAVKTPGRIAFVVLVVTPHEFDRMKSDWGEYSTTLPSGTYLGKRWLRRTGDEWSMGHYVAHPDPGTIGIEWTPISVESP